jgi:hypothetical protein
MFERFVYGLYFGLTLFSKAERDCDLSTVVDRLFLLAWGTANKRLLYGDTFSIKFGDILANGFKELMVSSLLLDVTFLIYR